MPMQEIILGTDGLGVDLTKFSTLVIDQRKSEVLLMFVKVKVEHQGTFRQLIATLESTGKTVKVYHPVVRTQQIISKMGYSQFDGQFWAKQ